MKTDKNIRMKYKDYLDMIPPQTTGTSIEVEASISLKTPEEAGKHYAIVKERLMDMGNWHSLTGLLSAKFQIISSELVDVDRKVQQGDFVKIDIPGPGNSRGDGYDWVRVQEVKEMAEGDVESTGFQVRPSFNPFDKIDDVAHFYAETATSNFIVTREGNRLSALVIDRNLKPNAEADFLIDTVRNSATGIGAIGIFSKMQWQRLADGLLENTGK